VLGNPHEQEPPAPSTWHPIQQVSEFQVLGGSSDKFPSVWAWRPERQVSAPRHNYSFARVISVPGRPSLHGEGNYSRGPLLIWRASHARPLPHYHVQPPPCRVVLTWGVRCQGRMAAHYATNDIVRAAHYTTNGIVRATPSTQEPHSTREKTHTNSADMSMVRSLRPTTTRLLEDELEESQRQLLGARNSGRPIPSTITLLQSLDVEKDALHYNLVCHSRFTPRRPLPCNYKRGGGVGVLDRQPTKGSTQSR
jgi:hypothetical protein